MAGSFFLYLCDSKWMVARIDWCSEKEEINKHPEVTQGELQIWSNNRKPKDSDKLSGLFLWLFFRKYNGNQLLHFTPCPDTDKHGVRELHRLFLLCSSSFLLSLCIFWSLPVPLTLSLAIFGYFCLSFAYPLVNRTLGWLNDFWTLCLTSVSCILAPIPGVSRYNIHLSTRTGSSDLSGVSSPSCGGVWGFIPNLPFPAGVYIVKEKLLQVHSWEASACGFHRLV